MVFRFILGDLILGMLRVKCVSNLEVNLYRMLGVKTLGTLLCFMY
jgi:hypothetical protein